MKGRKRMLLSLRPDVGNFLRRGSVLAECSCRQDLQNLWLSSSKRLLKDTTIRESSVYSEHARKKI